MKKDVRRKGILGFPVGPVRETLLDILEGRRVTSSNPAEIRKKREAKSDELPPEFKPLERKYGKKMARTAYKFIENYINSMFGEEE